MYHAVIHQLPLAAPCWRTGPQIVATPPNLAVLLAHCGQLIRRKISKFDAIRYQILTQGRGVDNTSSHWISGIARI